MSQTKVTDAVRTVTVVDGAKITTGTIPEARITALAATKLTGTVADARLPATALNSNVDLTTLSANNLTSGTIADARFPATLPAISGANLTGISSTTFAQAPVMHHNTGGGGSLNDSTLTKRWNGLTVDITPTSASNKVLIYVQQQQRIHQNGGGIAGWDACHNYLSRGTSSTTIGAVGAATSGFGGTITQIWEQHFLLWTKTTTQIDTQLLSYWYLDAPATTSLCRYFPSISNTGQGEYIAWKVDPGMAQMYAMEIKL